MNVNPARLHRHLRVCQSLIDRLAPNERSAWNPTLGRNPDIPRMDMNQMIAAVWVNLSRMQPELDYSRVVFALNWLLDPSAPALRDPRPSERESRSAPPSTPAPPPQ